MYIEYPHIYGTTEEKLDRISSYLFKLAEISNYNLEQTTPEGIFRQAAEAVASAETETIEKEKKAKFCSLRDLIIKSAGSVMISEQEISQSLSGLFVAESDFGTFKKETEQKFTANSESFTSLFAKDEEITANLTSYKSEMQNYIFAGYDNDTFVLDIGLLKDTYSVDDKTVLNQTPKKLRITPDRLSLFSGDNEVAYLSEQAIYFPNAHITGGTLNIGGGTFTVDSKGVINASSGTIAGWKIGTGANGLPAGATAIFNTVKGTEGKFSIGLQASAASTANVNFFVKKYNTKDKIWEDVFYVKNNGKLFAKDAEIEGKITATGGSFSGSLNAATGTFAGELSAATGTFKGSLSAATGTFAGSLSAATGTFTGGVTATSGKIGKWEIGVGQVYSSSATKLFSNNISKNDSGEIISGTEIGFNPISINDFIYSSKYNTTTKKWENKFQVSRDGTMTCKEIFTNSTTVSLTSKPSSGGMMSNGRYPFAVQYGSNVNNFGFAVDTGGNVYAEKFYTNNNSTDLQTQINGKASTSHTHSNYALTSHTHGNTELWNGNHFLTSTASSTAQISLDGNISDQNIGVVLVFSPCTLDDYGNFGNSTDYFYQTFFIPKAFIPSGSYKTMSFALHYEKYNLNGNKILKIYNNKIEGYITNSDAGSSNGITYNNKRFILRKVYGV